MAEHREPQQVVDADEVRDAERARPLQHLDGRALRDEAAGLEHRAVVGEGEELGRAVRDEDHRHAELALHPQEEAEHVAGELGVEGARRLVEEQELGVREQRAAEGHALALAAREVRDAALEERREPEHLEHAPAGRRLRAAPRAPGA